jgi:hypothetical protein
MGEGNPDEYQYRISPASLAMPGNEVDCEPTECTAQSACQSRPPSLIKALERWDKQGSEARFEKMVV